MRFIDLFGGIGGFRYGIERAGIKTKCVLYADIDKYATAVYNYNFKENWKPTDITKLKSEDIPDHDILCGGFPCQSFSIAGKRKGFNDTRGTLFFEICRIARDKKSPVLFLENVKGLLSHGNRTTGIFYDKRKKTYSTEQTQGSDEVTLKASGETFGIITNTLYELGYMGEAGTLNSKNFGVPQNRERVFIIGHLRGQRSRQVFPIGQDGGKANDLQGQSTNTLTERYEGAQAGGSYIIESKQLSQIGMIGNNAEANRVYSTKGIARTVKNGGGMGAKSGLYLMPEIAGTLTGGGHSGGLHSDMTTIPVLTPDRPEKRQNGRRFKENGEPMFTLTGQDIHGVMQETYLNLATYIKCYANATKTNAREILSVLQKEINSTEGEEWQIDEFASFWENEILQSNMYEESLQGALEGGCSSARGKLSCKANIKIKYLREVWKRRKNGYSPQKQRQIEQLIKQLRSHLSFLSYKRASSKTKMQDMQCTNEGIGLLRQALPKIQKIWESLNVQKKSISTPYRIRRLVPTECEALQSFPRDWTKYGLFNGKKTEISDAQRYKMCGNSVTTNVIQAIAEKVIV